MRLRIAWLVIGGLGLAGCRDARIQPGPCNLVLRRAINVTEEAGAVAWGNAHWKLDATILEQEDFDCESAVVSRVGADFAVFVRMRASGFEKWREWVWDNEGEFVAVVVNGVVTDVQRNVGGPANVLCFGRYGTQEEAERVADLVR